MTRSYTVAEIDLMREVIRRREVAKVWPSAYMSGGGCGPVPTDQFNREIERVREDWRAAEKRAEDMLRTYMLAGVDPQEVAAA